MKPLLLVLIPLSETSLASIAEVAEIVYAPDAARRDAALAERGNELRLLLTNGTVGVTAEALAAMPALTLVCALGAGYENLAIDAARARGIALANGAGTNDDCVADHAMGLLLATVRGIPQHDRACRAGIWRDQLPLRPNLAYRRLGILGLGTIGRKIARRALGFEMEIGYHNRRADPQVPHRHFDTLTGLAAWCDCLVIATPGGPSTRHLVNAEVLAALGGEGFLINIARGSVVDTAALAAALRDGQIRGAGLDVYESEPAPPAELLGFDNVVLTPHVAGTSPEAVQAAVQHFVGNVRRHLVGEALRTPI
jgi:lactate dehydrogenase-like 2-hydroxyacid dehydrogenase